ncbi:hypothetical protein TNCV_1132911 [Trichonephila clavipes]|nr:hypothetical protein TNCV_1132911 [Trichonephila clavipes]
MWWYSSFLNGPIAQGLGFPKKSIPCCPVLGPTLPVSDINSFQFFLKAVDPPESSDEAHFWLNGNVNKQNCRIWSEANPQVYVETPLHPEKLTVWCALWAGGTLLQKR